MKGTLQEAVDIHVNILDEAINSGFGLFGK